MNRRRKFGGKGGLVRAGLAPAAVAISLAFSALPVSVQAQDYSFSGVTIEGNDRIEAATILKFAGIAKGKAVSAAELNDAYQRISQSGLFETVELVPSGNQLIIRVVEYPTINVVNFEGNRRLEDEELAALIKSQSRRVFSPAQAESDAAAIAKAYSEQGRLAARVEPRIIRRDGNRVDLVFEVREGRVTEIERLSFTGNQAFSDRRLRRVLETKQAGIFRRIVQRDSFVADRTEFDKQLLRDFYNSRGYVDFQVLSVASEYSRERDAFFLTFNVREGQQFRFGKITTVSEYEGIDAAEYADVVSIRDGASYSPLAIDTTITKMETIALRNGLDFLRVEPRITRNEKEGTLDVAFVLTKGARVFVERIDIEGNATTLDEVVRRQFRTVEGDPLNAREIRDAAERIRALGFFTTAEVNANPGTGPDQVIVDVNVDEKPTGSLNFGASYSVANGVGFNVGLSEANFLGRGQYVSVNLNVGTDKQNSSITFIEPALLDRDLKFRFNAYYSTSNNDNARFDTESAGIQPSIEFPLNDLTRLELRYKISSNKLSGVGGDTPADSSPILLGEEGTEISSALGYTLSYDTRIAGIDPTRGLLLRFNQDFAGLGGDVEQLTTTALASYQRKIMREEVTLRAELEGGVVHRFNGDTRVLDRFSGNGKIRGFEPNGIGPRDLGAVNEDALGGNYFAVARLEAEFPLGLPTEYGISGGLFADVGSVWGLDNTAGAGGAVDDSLNLRAVVGFSVFWESVLGPLRFNFSHALKKEDYDREQTFDLTVSTQF
ncbi:MAG TPA: outer membrane protein assembly factor BamA [Albidovulum sp.]|uniref:outer membrane protein assembly factor BamA n=1 Tax=Albidovulum sp. TaxID=1872424 RepID=UPI001DE7A1E9|nr:outer membrane protein assembly factor BamA [Paracoccaceae bacterium]HPE25834.1 outer membrane protein assembly factor BamA [Albidovulum sp.]HRV63282.1 outer membrane protein assembly factor BamA [Albidovulum sp.]